MSEAQRKTACITGATSGIGAAFARILAGRGYDLIITGRREAKIRESADEIAARHGVRVETLIAEFSEDLQVDETVRRIRECENLEILVNNAGFSSKSLFHKSAPADHEAMVKVHVLASIRLARAALPGMIRRGRGAVINVSSTAAFTPRPKQAVYAASKCFLNLFSESLHLELLGTGVKVQVLCPGLTRTDFHEKLSLRAEDVYKVRGPGKALSADAVVEASLRCLDKGRPVCIPGAANRLTALAVRLLPRPLIRRAVHFRRGRGK